jgi:exonuclease III
MSNLIHQPAPTPCLQLGHIITQPSHHHDIFINIATQNIGGLKSESERGSGPKISTLRALAREKLDFFVLTETRVDVRAVKKIKLKRNLQATMHSLHPRPRGGVIVFSKREHKLIPDSVRTSQSPGHFAVGVYEIKTTRVIVAGVYGCSESGDRASLAIIQDLRDRIQELSHVYHTRKMLLAGDFNVTLFQADSNNQLINKPNTVQALHTLIEDHQLVDLGSNAGCLTHTWHRRDSSGQSSRSDLILTNILMQRRRYKLTQTIFDHAFVHGTINLDRRQTTFAMKDFVLGSEEFLIRSQERNEEFFLSRGKEEVRGDGLGGGGT